MNTKQFLRVQSRLNWSTLWIMLVLGLVVTSAQAQLYKWVGADGRVTYSDTPPPKDAKQTTTKQIGRAGPDTSNLPYELAQAVKNNPVTLYTAEKCAACDSAKQLLKTRGVPYTEKTVSTNEDINRLQNISGNNQLPVMTVARNTLQGFEAGSWIDALTDAGYPKSNVLPSTYKNPAPEPAAPISQHSVESKPTSAGPKVSRPAPPIAPAAPQPATPGFRF